LRIAPEGMRADNILIDTPSIGQLTGNGIVGGDNSLDFKMLLKPSSSTAGSLLGKLTGAAAGVQSKGIPFLIKGTTSNPSFVPSISGVADSLNVLQGKPGQGQDQGLGGILGGFLDKKKKKP
jgi:hypothetical protein